MDMFTIDGEPREATEARQRILDSFNDLIFIEDGHRYLLHGKELDSVSQIGHRFESRPFEAHKQAAIYAQKHGGTPEYWLDMWAQNSLKSTSAGTKVHEFGESLSYLRNGLPDRIQPSAKQQLSPDRKSLIPQSPKEEAVVHFMDALPSSFHLVLNEAMVYSGKNPDAQMNLKEQICGTFDMLYYYDGEGGKSQSGFVLMDYKTNKSLTSEWNRNNGVMLLEPFTDMVQEDLSLYAIQLSLYALMLEDIGLRVLGRRLIWLKDDGTHERFSLVDLSARLRKVL